MFKELHQLPEGILKLKAHELEKALESPALIHLQGKKNETLFISVLLHGNEPAGWDALRRLLKKYTCAGGKRELPRNMSIFIGNVAAAAKKMRRLDDQVDYNRVWPGGDASGPEADMMHRIVEIMKDRNLFASLDIHNNTGMNPHYGCINDTGNRFLRLAHLFRRLVIYFTRPSGVQSLAMSRLCPSITLEAGKAGDKRGITHVVEYIEECLNLHELSDKELHHEEIALYHTVATVKVPSDTSFCFGKIDNSQISFLNELERFNFSELKAGTVWAELQNDDIKLSVSNESGKDVFDEFFTVKDNKLLSGKTIMPAMLTTDHKVIEQDCLCYLMERYDRNV